MLTQAQLYGVFNSKLSDFLEDLRPIIGKIPEYALLVSSVALMSRLEPSQNHKLFSRYVTSHYREPIVNHDDSFFLDSTEADYADLSKVQGVKTSTADIISLLKSIWGSLSDSDRQAVWAHLDVLIMVSDKIVGAATP